jgi:tail protein|nr:MAG TPA: Major tail protein [Caudoviricetes sp.]
MTRILHKGDFYKNSPLTDFFNTIHFTSNTERDNFFDTVIWKNFSIDMNYNVDTSKGELLIYKDRKSFKDLQGVNYCRLYSNNEEKWYYYFIVKVECVNEKVTRLYLVIDVVMTYCQGKVLNNLRCINVEREHLTGNAYTECLEYLQKNNDILQTYTKKYSFEKGLYFGECIVLILSSANLTANFGDINNPIIYGSQGGVCDDVYSPLSIYMVDYLKFNNFIQTLSQYAWVQQHINKMVLLPKMFVDMSQFEKVTSNIFTDLYTTVRNARHGVSKELTDSLEKLSINFIDLLYMLNLDVKNIHLLRNEYINVELHNYNGDSINIDVSDLTNQDGLTFDCAKVVGYENIVSFFIKNSKVAKYELDHKKQYQTSLKNFKGTSLNNSITFKDFDNLPMAINTHDLSLSKNANQRALQESRLFSSRLNNVLSGTDNTSRLYDAISLTSNISIANLFGRLNDEYNYYKDLKAQSEDKKIEVPSVLQGKNINALTRNNGIYGITLKIATLSKYEFNRVKEYYKIMGFQVDRPIDSLNDVESMNYINYVKFTGTFNFKNVDTAHNEILKQVFSQGVRLWHYNEFEDGNDFIFKKSKITNNDWR